MSEGRSFVRVASQWLVAAALIVVLVFFFLSVPGVQLTSRSTGERIQRRAVAALTDIDALMPSIQDQLHEEARKSDGDVVRVPGFPIPVDLKREDAASLEGEQLRNRIVDEAARRIYDDGMSSWADGDSQARQRIERVSTAGAVDRGLGFVRDDWHTIFIAAAVFFGLLATGLAAALMLSLRPAYVRLMALGAVLVAAALPSLAAAVAVRFAFKTAQTDADPFVDRMLALGVDTMAVPIRDYLALTTLGFAIVGVAGFFMWLASRCSRPAKPSYLDTCP